MELPNASPESQRPFDVSDPGGASDSGSPLSEVSPDARAFEEDNKLDHRPLGFWATRYDKPAWAQISIEFGYLAIVLISCTATLVWIGYQVAPPTPLDQRAISFFGIQLEYPRDRTFLLWLSVALSGVVGGSCFALKYLYHAVAKGEWNRDRILWRFIVPPLSGTVAVFVSMLVASGVIALIDSRFFSSFYGAVGAGWLIGYFSDNVLAALQKLAHRWFGTVDESKASGGAAPADRGQA
jgi:hypothetical protein